MDEVGGEAPCWSRGRWARHWLEHDDAGAAALELEAGDDLEIDESDFPALARALCHQGLAALYEDGYAYVYTPERAQEILAEMAREALSEGARMPPASSPAPARRRAPARVQPATPIEKTAIRTRRG